MTRKTFAPWLGALVATPALTVSVAPATAKSIQPAPSAVSAGAGERAALQAGLLSMSLDDKLAVAGDRVGADPFALSVGGASRGPWNAASGRTNTDIPECHSTGAAGAVKGKVHKASAACQSAGAVTGQRSHNTGTCSVQVQAQTAGSTHMAQASRTNAGKAICAAAPAVRNCGATTPGVTQAVTKGAPAHPQ